MARAWKKLSSDGEVEFSEIDSIYLGETAAGDPERFVVSLIVGYDDHRDNVVSPQQAVAAAIAMTKDPEQHSTMWHCYDRLTGKKSFIRQGDVAELAAEISA